MSFEIYSDPESDDQRYETLLKVTDVIVHHRPLPQLLKEMSQNLRKVVNFDFINLSIHDPTFDTVRLHLWEGGDTAPVTKQEEVPGDTAGSWVWQSQQSLLFPDLRRESRFPETLEALRKHGYRSYCLLPVTTARNKLGVLGIGSLRESAYDKADLQLMERVAALLALAKRAQLKPTPSSAGTLRWARKTMTSSSSSTAI